MRILLAEDNNVAAQSLRTLLIDHGHEVRAVADGESVLSLLQQKIWDVVIMDYYMPAMNGIETLKRMRNANDQTPVVFTTAASSDEVILLRKMVRDLGHACLLRKPFSMEELMQVLPQVIVGAVC